MLNHEPIWFDKKEDKSNQPKFSVFVGTPCHSEVSIHYTQSVLELQHTSNAPQSALGCASAS